MNVGANAVGDVLLVDAVLVQARMWFSSMAIIRDVVLIDARFAAGPRQTDGGRGVWRGWWVMRTQVRVHGWAGVCGRA